MKNIKEMIVNNVVAIIVIIVLLFSAYLAYYSVVVVPANKIKAQEKAQKLEYRRINLLKFQYTICKVNADINYNKDWDGACKLIDKSKNCALPLYKAQIVNRKLKDSNKECLDVFKAQK